MVFIKFLTKSNCCLCERGLFILKRLKNLYHLENNIELIDITNNTKYKDFKNQVPVVLINEKLISCMKLEERKIREAISIALFEENSKK